MSARAQDLVYGVANQRLTFDAPEGRPSSVASVKVFSSGAGDEATEQDAIAGSAEIDAANTTVSGASGAGQANARLLAVTSDDDFVVGRPYLVAGAGGGREWFEVVGIASNVLTTRHPLANGYAAADTVVGTRLSVPLKLAWVSDKNKLTGGRDPADGYRVRWVYTVASVQYVHDSYFDLVRYAGGHSVLLSDVEAMYPGYKAMLPTYHKQDDGRRLVDEAHEQVTWDLVDVDLDESAVMNQDAINRATLLRFGVVLAKTRLLQGQGDAASFGIAKDDYEAFMNKLFRAGAKVAVSVDSSGAGAKVTAMNVWRPR